MNGLFQIKSKQSGLEGVGWGLTFLKKIPEIFRFLTLVCLCHWNFIYFWKFHKTVIPTGISKAKNQDPCHGNSTWLFLGQPWPGNSTFFHWPLRNLEFPHSVYLFNTLGNSMSSNPHTSVWIFLEWNSQINQKRCYWVAALWVFVGLWKKLKQNNLQCIKYIYQTTKTTLKIIYCNILISG